MGIMLNTEKHSMLYIVILFSFTLFDVKNIYIYIYIYDVVIHGF